MSLFLKTIINNLNSMKYMRNINRVRPADVPYDMSGNNPMTKPADLGKISDCEEDLRHNNLKVFAKAYSSAKMQKFFVVSLPALIGAVTIGSFTVPTHYEKQKNINMYNVETTTLASDLGQNTENEKAYYALIDKNIVNYPDMENLSSTGNHVDFRIYDGTNSIVASFSMDKNGGLEVSNIYQEEFIDISGLEEKEYGEMDPKYAQLFDDIIDIIKESSYLSKSEEENLNNLTSSEKSKMMMQIIKRTDIGKERVTVNASRVPLRVILLIILAFYLIIEAWVLYDNDGLDSNPSINIDEEGHLSRGGNEEFGFVFGTTKYRELFMRAERERIIKTWKLAKENISLEDRYDIFTHFEKKLIKKYEKDNEDKSFMI